MCAWLAFMMMVFGCNIYSGTCGAQLLTGPWCQCAIHIQLINRGYVRGVTFTVNGCDPLEIEVHGRAEGFFAKVNSATGKVVILSLTGKKIAPGAGKIMTLGFSCSCSAIWITDFRTDQTCLDDYDDDV